MGNQNSSTPWTEPPDGRGNAMAVRGLGRVAPWVSPSRDLGVKIVHPNAPHFQPCLARQGLVRPQRCCVERPGGAKVGVEAHLPASGVTEEVLVGLDEVKLSPGRP